MKTNGYNSLHLRAWNKIATLFVDITLQRMLECQSVLQLLSGCRLCVFCMSRCLLTAVSSSALSCQQFCSQLSAVLLSIVGSSALSSQKLCSQLSAADLLSVVTDLLSVIDMSSCLFEWRVCMKFSESRKHSLFHRSLLCSR